MNIMKRIVGSVMVALILIPLQNAQAWDNGNRSGWGGYYAQGHRGYGEPSYYGNRRYYGHNGYYGNRGYYGHNGYYGNHGNYGNSGYGQTVRCESNDGRTRRCAVSSNGRAELVRQLSRSACVEGRTWGQDRNAIWVAQGCRGDFQVMPGYGNNYGNGYGYGRVFRCESNDGRVRECAANTRAGVQLVRQLSRSACIEGRTWGYGRTGIWVAEGCRAEFRSY